MATRFELVLHGDNPASLRAAAEEALDEVERLEQQLSLYRPDTEIARVNARAHREPVRVSPPVFRLLQHAEHLHRETGGAFDITIAPLLRCWGLMGGSGRIPEAEQLAAARACVGMHLVQLDPAENTVRFDRPGVMLDLGAIGKGYAVEQAAERLRELGVASALIHGGTSTIYAIGSPPDQPAWKVAVEIPRGVLPVGTSFEFESVGANDAAAFPEPEGRSANFESAVSRISNPRAREGLGALPTGSRRNGRLETCTTNQSEFKAVEQGRLNPESPTLLAVVPLCNESLSVSAVWGKSFETGGKTYGHILDPRTGAPADRAILAAVVLPSATETDALSTALLTVGSAGHAQIIGLRRGIYTLVAEPTPNGVRVECHGMGTSPGR